MAIAHDFRYHVLLCAKGATAGQTELRAALQDLAVLVALVIEASPPLGFNLDRTLGDLQIGPYVQLFMRTHIKFGRKVGGLPCP